MERKKFILALPLLLLFAVNNAFSYDNNVYGGKSGAKSINEDFRPFLKEFTSSASFQYSRIKFPLESPIVLLTSDEEEQSFPFTKEKWPLLDLEAFEEGRVVQEEGDIYIGGFVLDEPARKEFEAGYEESELILRVVFELIGGKWYVTDCYNSWYSFDLSAEELEETILQVQEGNKLFEEEHP